MLKLKLKKAIPELSHKTDDDNCLVFDSENDFLECLVLYDGSFFSCIEEDELDEQLLLKAVKNDSECFIFIPQSLRSNAIYKHIEKKLEFFCKDALKHEDNCWDDLMYWDGICVENKYLLNVRKAMGFPDREQQDKLLLKLISACTHHIAYIPKDRIIPAFKEAAWARAGASYKDVLENKLSQEKCNKIVASHGEFLKQGLVPEAYQTIALVKAILANHLPPYTLDMIPERFYSQELYEYAVKVNEDNIRYVPDQCKTYEMCRNSVVYHLSNLKYIPETMEQYENICLDVLKKASYSPFILKYISTRCSRYYEFCVMAMSKMQKTGWGSAIDKLPLPDEVWTEELFTIGLKRNPYLFKLLPERFMTPEHAELAYFNSKPFLRDLKLYTEDSITENMCQDVVSLNPKQLKNVPQRFLTVELLAKATTAMQIKNIKWEAFDTATILKFVNAFFHLPSEVSGYTLLNKKQWKELAKQDAIHKPILEIYQSRLNAAKDKIS